MGLQAYALRAEYEDGFDGASVAYGPDAKHFDVAEALEKGDGKIVTDDVLLQAALDNIQAANGPLLKKVSVGDDAIITPSPGDEPPAVLGQSQPPQSTTAPPQEEQKLNQAATVTADSEYEHMSDDDLRQEVKVRGLQVKQGASAEELAAALEADDEKRGGQA